MSPNDLGNYVSRTLLQGMSKKILVTHLYLLLLVPLFFVAYSLKDPGISITGDFPYQDTPDYAINKLWLWIERGSRDAFEILPRFPISGFSYLLSFVYVPSELVTKIMIVMGFFLASFSFYFSFLLFFRRKFTTIDLQLGLSSLLGSLFYAYNVWSFNRIHHWYLWIGYSIFPLFFISLVFSFKDPKNWKYIMISTLLWSFSSTTPHMTLFYGITLLVTFSVFFIHGSTRKRKHSVQVVIPLLLTIFFYCLVNMYWIYPSILASQEQTLVPNYVFTKENVDTLSRAGTWLNSFRIMGYWQNTNVDIPSVGSLLYYIWLPLTFVIPIIAFSSLLIKNPKKYVFVFSGIGLITIPLAMGSQSPFDYFEFGLSFTGLSNFIWLLRDADKLGFLTAFCYSFLMALVSFKIFAILRTKLKGNKKYTAIAAFYVALIIGSICTSYPFYIDNMKPLEPVKLPMAFDGLNSYLSTVNTDKVYFIPYPLVETQWDQNGYVGSIYQLHSSKPSIGTGSEAVTNNYYNFLAKTISENRSKTISNLINPLGTSYLVFHNDTWSKWRNSNDPNTIELLRKLYLLNDLENIENIGFYNIFRTSNNDNSHIAGPVNIPSENLVVSGGLDISASLNIVPSFNSLKSSVFFMDDVGTRKSTVPMNIFDKIVMKDPMSINELAISFFYDENIIAPFDATNHNNPSTVWSKAGIKDPSGGEFHPYLEDLGISNWDFDYGKGIVMTKAIGTNLTIPFDIEDEGNHDIYLRYMKNQKGGQIRIYLDDRLMNELDTFDKISNKFEWQKIGDANLLKGRHAITLENVGGFNAVNIFAIIAPEDLKKVRQEFDGVLGKKQVIYVFEAESNLYNKKGADSGLVYYLSNSNITKNEAGMNHGQSKTFEGQFKVPSKMGFVDIRLLTNQSYADDPLSINELRINSAFKKYQVYGSDYELKQRVTIPLASLRNLDWLNYDKDFLDTSLETDNPIHGSASLRVDLKPASKVGWNTISTDLIPVNENVQYNASLHVATKDVKQLHSKIIYFDSKKEQITGVTDYVSNGKDGTFNEIFSSSILPPKEAKYLKYQILTSASNPIPSYYLLDDVKLEEIDIPEAYVFKINQNYSNFDINHHPLTPMNNNSLRSKPDPYNMEHYTVSSKPFAVKENHIYNYNMTIEAENVNPVRALASFKSSADVSENRSKYGSNASNGAVLSLSAGSEVSTTFDILKPANYTVALRAITCDTCSFLGLSFEDGDGNVVGNRTISLNQTKDNSLSQLNWVYSKNISLKPGKHEMKLYSKSQTDIDLILVYSTVSNNSSSINNNNDYSVHNLFISDNVSTPAKIIKYERVNPTKHIVQIGNATKPFMISFAESYNKLWTAHSDTNKYDKNENIESLKSSSLPLYGVTNGFVVNKTGDYTLVIEFEPQNWFTIGAIISIFAFVLLIWVYVSKRNNIFRCSKFIVEKILKTWQ